MKIFLILFVEEKRKFSVMYNPRLEGGVIFYSKKTVGGNIDFLLLFSLFVLYVNITAYINSVSHNHKAKRKVRLLAKTHDFNTKILRIKTTLVFEP